jgi:hypothetical protein
VLEWSFSSLSVDWNNTKINLTFKFPLNYTHLEAMKIQLERKLSSCPDQMTCVVCHETFWSSNIRALLYSHNNLLQGDVCPSCLKLRASRFQQKLRNQANRLIQESIITPRKLQLLQDRAFELLETSEENITYPTVFHWIFKRLENFAEESRELEAARFRSNPCHCEEKRARIDQNSARTHLLATDED